MFIFGCILLLAFFLYFTRRRLRKARWEGEKQSLQGTDFQIKTHTYRGNIVEVWIGMASVAESDFSLQSETWVERFFKRTGLAKEYQTGNRTFDDAVYIVADDAATQREITTSPALMKAFLALLDINTGLVKVHALRHRQGRLWLEVRFATIAGMTACSEQDLQKLARLCVPRLAAIVAALPARQTALPGRSRPRFGGASAMLPAAAMALAGTAGLHMIFWFSRYFVFSGQVPYTLDQAALITDALALGGTLLLALLLAGFMLTGKSARAHLIVLELLLVGGPGALGTAWAQLRCLNMEFDRTEAVNYEVQVQGRRKTDRSYYIAMDDWLKPGETVEIYVKEKLYAQARPGALLDIRQRAGYLGYRWVESISAASDPPE